MPTNFIAVYAGLVLLRVCFALWGTGYIHPDEYFQNGEVVAGSALGVHTLLTWEWDPYFPCRSIVPVWITTGIPFTFVKFLSRGEPLSPRTIFVAERLSFLCSSFLLDYATYKLVNVSARMHALILLASSYVLHTYQVRPFTNSIEAVLVALSLLFLRKNLVAEGFRMSMQTIAFNLVSLGLVAVCGLFTRITFAAFCLPIAFEVLKLSQRQAKNTLRPWIRLLTPSLLVGTLAGLGFVYADSTYFVPPDGTPTLELTPLNFLRYNLLPANLAEHGLHPRWLHLFVNLPMIASPGLLFYIAWADWDYCSPRMADKGLKEEEGGRTGPMETMQKVFSRVRWSAITLLSIQPHQEPRFMIPLVMPMIALVKNNGRIFRAGRWFLTLWISFNLILAVLFGILHQGGVVPSLFRVHDIIYNRTNGVALREFHVVYWKTYMPPRHLLAIRSIDVQSKAVTVSDFAGTPPEGVIQGLQRPGFSSKPLHTLLVAPFYTVHQLGFHAQKCVTERTRVFPHLDLDHIGEVMTVGWRDWLSLGIFDVDQACLRDHHAGLSP